MERRKVSKLSKDKSASVSTEEPEEPKTKS